ncbi:hypothetical protein [Stappia sp. ES.058]|uniref:hypothetical protein n=1 Tax=Stappia sp. ES.058 TaxID=1881061 RepID=UPI0018D2FB32|nr:hypothetical protein [Stappia sp. ES.058]
MLRLLLEMAIEEAIVMGADVSQIIETWHPRIKTVRAATPKWDATSYLTEFCSAAYKRTAVPNVRNSLSIQIGGRGGSV